MYYLSITLAQFRIVRLLPVFLNSVKSCKQRTQKQLNKSKKAKKFSDWGNIGGIAKPEA